MNVKCFTTATEIINENLLEDRLEYCEDDLQKAYGLTPTEAHWLHGFLRNYVNGKDDTENIVNAELDWLWATDESGDCMGLLLDAWIRKYISNSEWLETVRDTVNELLTAQG